MKRKVVKEGKVALRDEYTGSADFGITLEENGYAYISGTKYKSDPMDQLDYLKRAHESLGEFIQSLEEGIVFEDRKWYEFWKRGVK